MRKTAFYILSALTLYLSAMYRSMALMLLFPAEILLAACMWILAHYLYRHLTVTLPKRSIVAQQSAEYGCDYDIVNSARLPVTRFRIRLKIRYFQEKRGTVRYLREAAEPGTERKRFQIRALYCGLVCLKLDRLRVYDYLALFDGEEALAEEMRIAVLPPVLPLRIEVSGFPWNSENAGQENTAAWQSGDAAGEIRQLREYQSGDSSRHIHWNQSARTDRIWVKEYEREVNSQVEFLLEINLAQWKKPKEMDGFYRLLYSILLGLLRQMDSVRVSWYDGHPERLAEAEIRDEGQCREMLLRLYQMNSSEWSDTDAKALLESYSLVHDKYLKLDSELCWYQKETVLYRFSAENMEQEIMARTFAL